MRTLEDEKVIAVQHWSDGLFSFKTTRKPTFRFENGQFVMIGLEVDSKPLLRAYSIASANYEPYLEFFSIKIPNGALTSRLQNIQVGDTIKLSTRPAGTLVAGHLRPGKRLFLLATGTGLAPFMSIIKDPEIYAQFEKVILVHCVRRIADLAYKDTINNELPNNEFFGEEVSNQLIYYPCVTREPFMSPSHQKRITELLKTDELTDTIDLAPLNPEEDRLMLCGNQHMLLETIELLKARGFEKATSRKQGEFVIEQAFVEK